MATILRLFVLLVLLSGPSLRAAAPSHAHRYPDALVASVWMPGGPQWIRLEQVAPGCYQGSVEFRSDGWMPAYEYYEFSCMLTMDDVLAPLRFHHEFRPAPGEASPPSELWATLTYDWEAGCFRDTSDFAAVFVDPAVPQQPPAPAVSPPGGGPGGAPALAPPSAGQAPRTAAAAGAAGGNSGNPYDPEGYDSEGYDRDGYDRQGFDRAGVYRVYGPDGFDEFGYDREGYDRAGFDRTGYSRAGLDVDGYPYGTEGRSVTPPVPEDGVYGADGYDADGYDRQGFDRAGVYRDAAHSLEPEPPRYDARGFDGSTGLNVNGTYYDDLGYDIFGYDSAGFDDAGYDRNGFDHEGRNRLGVDIQGYDRDGYNVRGFNRDGIHRNRTLYDDAGFDIQGYDRQGRYFGDFDINAPGKPQARVNPEEPSPVPAAPAESPAHQAMAALLDDEGFPSRLEQMSDAALAGLLTRYGSVDNISPEQYAALGREFFDYSLGMLWYDLDARIAMAEFGLSDEDPEELRSRQARIEAYLFVNKAAGGGGGVAAGKTNPPDLVNGPIEASPTERSGIRKALTSAAEWMEEHPKTMGLVRGFGGAAEVLTGAVTALGTGGTASPLAFPLILHGVDQIIAGTTQAITGEPTQSGLEKAVTATAEAAGASPETAKAIGAAVDATTGIALNFGVGAAQGAVRAAASEAEALNAVTKEAEVVGAVAKETQVAAVGEAAGGGAKAVLAAEDCNGEGLKRLFARLPKNPSNSKIAHVQTEAEIAEIWAQLEKTGVAIEEYKPGKLRMILPDGTDVVKYGCSTDDTLTLAFNVLVDGRKAGQLKIHLKTK